MGANIKSSDLKYEYSKKATGGDNPKFTGKPDSALFNREEEYEVIPMLNKVLEVDYTVEEAMKLIISAGALEPKRGEKK